MVAHDLERSDERVTHGSSNSTSHHPLVAAARAGPATPTSPIPSTLTPGQIADALAKSPDNGATLDLTHLGLTDVGESGAEELASIGREQGVDEESPLVRCVVVHYCGDVDGDNTEHPMLKSCTGLQSTRNAAHDFRPFVSCPVPQPSQQ
jgi:hypothetical protein